MDAVPVSGALPVSTPATVVATAGTSSSAPLASSVLDARKALGSATRTVDDIVHYVGILLTLMRDEHELVSWDRLTSGATQLEWRFADRVLERPTLEVEMKLALSLLCSTLGARGEELAKQFHATAAQEAFGQSALAFEVLAAFLARLSGNRSKDEVADARARALLARMFAWQSQFAVLMRDGDKDRFAVGLGLAAEYWRLSQNELVRVPPCASLAAGYAHYWLMTCAAEKARTLTSSTPNGASTEGIAHLRHLEELQSLIVLEGDRAASAFASRAPQVRDACLVRSKAARQKLEETRDTRFKWLLILAKNTPEKPEASSAAEEGAVFAKQPLSKLFDTTVAARPPHIPDGGVPLKKNTLLTRIESAAHAWVLLQGGIEGIRRAVEAVPPSRAPPFRVDVPSQLRTGLADSSLVLSQRDEVTLALGRMTERLQWLRGSTVLVLPGEMEELEATIARLLVLFKKLKN